jgi:predicted Zn-dependent protease
MEQNSGLSVRLLIMVGIIGFSFFKYYFTTSVNPVTGEKQHVSLTPDQEIAMGVQSAPEMAAQMGGEFNDAKTVNAIKSIGNKLVNSTQAKQSPYVFKFHVLADPETVNAFALPGGQIFITVGLLKHLTSEDQIAGVLGHEMGHVINRHSAQQMEKQQEMSGIVNGVVMGATGGGGMASAQIAQYAAQMLNLKYSRNDELEADKFGLHYMNESGYKPTEMLTVMKVLADVSGGGNKSDFQSTHPSPANRMIKIKEELAKMGVASPN